MNTHEKTSTFVSRRTVLTTTLVVLAMTGLQTASVSFGEPDQTTQKTNIRAAKPAETENDQLEQNHVNLKKSRVFTFVDKTGLGHQHGVEGQLKSGSILLGEDQDAGELVFDMKSFDADTEAARKYLGLAGSTDSSTREQVNANMKHTSILNVAEYPTATFTIRSAKRLAKKDRDGKDRYELAGDFTLRGRKRPLTFVADVEQKDGMHHVKGAFSVMQTHYGITPFRKALGAVGVADKLTIHGDLWLAM